MLVYLTLIRHGREVKREMSEKRKKLTAPKIKLHNKRKVWFYVQDTAMIVEFENRKKLIYQSKNRDRFTSARERIKKADS